MFLIFNSLILSFSVTLRMVGPVILISLASIIVWFFLGFVTLGFASYVSEPITAAFISLFGIRVALALKGDMRQTDLKILALNATLYGVFFMVALSGLALLANAAGVLFALWQLGQPISLSALTEAAEPVLVSFAFLAVGSKMIVACVLLAALYTVMAVPMASAAREAGFGASGRGFFNGFGRSFIPLFCVFFVSIFLQFFFGLFTAVFAMLPLVMSAVSLILTQSLPDFDPAFILKGIASAAGVLWLNSWIWSVSALALLKFDDSDVQPAPAPSPAAEPAPDIRALRKSRERSF